MMRKSTSSPPKDKVKQLKLTRETVKDLALRGKRAQVVKGGVTTSSGYAGSGGS
jgi:hypothetical protein